MKVIVRADIIHNEKRYNIYKDVSELAVHSEFIGSYIFEEDAIGKIVSKYYNADSDEMSLWLNDFNRESEYFYLNDDFFNANNSESFKKMIKDFGWELKDNA